MRHDVGVRVLDPLAVERAVEGCPDPIIVADGAGVIELAAGGVEELLGWSADELVGSPLEVLVPAAGRRAHRAGFDRAVAGAGAAGPRVLRRVNALRADGSMIPVDVSVRVRPGRSAVATVRDARPALYAEVGMRLAAAPTLDAALRSLAESAVPQLADICLIDTFRGDGVERAAVAHLPELPAAAALRSYPPTVGGAHPAAGALASGATGWSAALSDEFLRATTTGPEHHRLVRSLRFRAYISVPLTDGDETLGALTLIACRPRTFVAADVTAAEALAAAVGGALRAARTQQAEHAVIGQLQRLLLPSRLASLTGVEVAADYRAADPLVGTGGDFFDTVALPSGRLGVVIGDVEGHDATAAIAMGQLRAALRTLSVTLHEPAEVFDGLRAAWDAFDLERTATVCAARIDPAAGSATLVSAGHPPPVLIGADGHARPVELPVVPLLGAPAAATEARTIAFGPGEVLVFYTDGIIERRGEHLTEGITRFANACRSCPTERVEDLAHRLLAGTCPAGDDDCAVLVVRRRP